MLFLAIVWLILVIVALGLIIVIQRKTEIHPDGKTVFRIDDYLRITKKNAEIRASLSQDLHYAAKLPPLSAGVFEVLLLKIATHLKREVDPLTKDSGQVLDFILSIGPDEDDK